MLIFLLSYPILLWGVNARAGVNYALFCEEIPELRVRVISSVVSVDNLNGGVELCLDHFVKDFE